MASTKPGHDVREQILRAAERLISRRGVDNTSLMDIALKTKLSRGTLYYYFPTKQDLLLAITDRHMDAVTADFVRLIRDRSLNDPRSILQQLFEMVLTDKMRGGVHAHLMQEAARGNRAVRKRVAMRYRAWSVLIVKEFQRLNIMRKRKEKAAFILSVIDGLVIRQFLFGANARKGSYPAFIAKGLLDRPPPRAAAPRPPAEADSAEG
jgi:AcrR family transcriptional regulator